MWSALSLAAILLAYFATAGRGLQTDEAARARRPGRARGEAAQEPAMPTQAVLHDDSDDDGHLIAKGWFDATGIHAASALARPVVNAAIGLPTKGNELDAGGHPFDCGGMHTTGGTSIGMDSSTLDAIPNMGTGIGAGTWGRSW